MYVTRPWSPIAILLNSMVKNILGHKLKGENYLRDFGTSNLENKNDPVLGGMEYIIIRPGGLLRKNILPEFNNNVLLGQGDTLSGKKPIARRAVAKILAASIMSPTFLKIEDSKNPGLTFEVCGNVGDGPSEQFDPEQLVSQTKFENDNKFVKVDNDEIGMHVMPFYTISLIGVASIALGAFAIISRR